MPWLWLGTWSMGGEGFGPQDARESMATLERALAAGVRHIDTAGFYGHGKSEQLVARILRPHRRRLFLSTKGGLVWEGREVRHRARPEDLRRALLDSLKRLRTDYVDLYQLHWPDPEVPLEESLGGLEELRREGLARYWGVGNLTADQVRRFISPDSGLAHQVHFNPVHRPLDVLAAGSDQGRCWNCVTSPLEQGLLGTGRSSAGLAALGRRDVRRRNPCFRDPRVADWLVEFQRLSAECPVSRVSLVILWILACPDVSAVIPGPRTVEQLLEVLEHRTWMDRLGLPPPPDVSCRRPVLEEAAGPVLWSLLERGPASTSRPT